VTDEVKAEVNLFMVDANNITTHVKLSLIQSAVVAGVEHYLTQFKAAGFKPDPSKAARTYGGGRQQQPKVTVQTTSGRTVEVSCPQCGGKVWDNRAENDKRESQGQTRRPDFACRDKDACQWKVWNGNDLAMIHDGGDEGERVDPNDLPFE